jgi:putative peptidoglycan lipid II flippase
MSSALGSEEQVAETLRQRIAASTRRIGFFVVPSAVGFIALGDVITAAIYQTGKFSHADSVYVWSILAGSGVGLVASTIGRLYSSAYYALRDTRTPLNYAILRVALTTVLGYVFALPLPHALGIDEKWGAAGLTASAGMAGWVEMLLLRSTLNARIGRSGLSASYAARLWTAAVVGAAVGWAIKLAAPRLNPIVGAIVILTPYGLVFFALTLALRIDEASALIARVVRPRWR